MVDQDDLAARLDHTREFIERRLGVRNRGDDELRYDHVEECIAESEPLSIHHGQCLDMRERLLRHTGAGFAQHRFGIVDPHYHVVARIIGERVLQ